MAAFLDGKRRRRRKGWKTSAECYDAEKLRLAGENGRKQIAELLSYLSAHPSGGQH
jgi:hypothetical protein